MYRYCVLYCTCRGKGNLKRGNTYLFSGIESREGGSRDRSVCRRQCRSSEQRFLVLSVRRNQSIPGRKRRGAKELVRRRTKDRAYSFIYSVVSTPERLRYTEQKREESRCAWSHSERVCSLRVDLTSFCSYDARRGYALHPFASLFVGYVISPPTQYAARNLSAYGMRNKRVLLY